MTLTAFILISLSALLHVLWNLISKTGRPTPAYFFIFSAISFVITFPLAIHSKFMIFSMPATTPLCAAAAGICCGALTGVGMSLAYRTTDFSISYPIMRAMPIVSTYFITCQLGLGEVVTLTDVIGMLLVISGCFATGITAFKRHKTEAITYKGLTGILLAICGTTCYTIFDSCGMKALKEASNGENLIYLAGCYSNLREVFIALSLLVIALSQKETRKGFNRNLFRSPSPYLAGVFSVTSYVFVLLAFPLVSNPGFVAAFKQVSIPLGVLAGIAILKEKASLTQIIGVVLIVFGIILCIPF